MRNIDERLARLHARRNGLPEPTSSNSFLTRATEMSPLAHADDYEARAAAGCLILAMKTKRILIGQRGIMGDFPMTWATIGGCLEEGEGPRTACRREVEEETGYGGIMRLVPLMESYDSDKDFTYYNFLGIVPHEFEPVKDEENNAFRWVEFNNWPEPRHPGFDKLLNNHISMTTVMRHLHGLK